jgi:NAD-dependent dihydropyrimidine dehydrogenase PreA subunit
MSKINYGPKIDPKYCNGCGHCYNDCPMDVFGWSKEAKRPTVDYPGECSFCCVCEIVCPERAVDVHFPLHTLLDFGIDPKKQINEIK